MRYRAMVCGPVTGTGVAGDAFRPRLGDDYPAVGWSDVTGRDGLAMPGDPALVVVEAEVDGAALAALEGDGRYVVLSAEEVTDGGQAG